MAFKGAELTLGDGDPRLNSINDGEKQIPVINTDMAPTDANYTKPWMRPLHDHTVPIEEYFYYAEQAREEERKVDMAGTVGILQTLIPSKKTRAPEAERAASIIPDVNISKRENRSEITEADWVNANRAFRMATAGACFYLITTDILGPFGLAYAFATTGYGPGVTLYTVFGFMAGLSGYLLYDMFLGLDSFHYPLKTVGDVAFRVYGRPMLYLLTFLQSIQLLMQVAVIIISNGLALSEVSKFKLCYAICCLIWALCGFALGQIRTLQKFGWLANLAIWINLLLMFITMGVAAHHPPLYSAYSASAGYTINPDLVTPDANGNYPSIQHSGGTPASTGGFIAAINGLLQAVYAYGGAQLFVEFMSEMRRPRDFLKAMWSAQAFIWFWYMLYGLFIYAYQGQYVQNPSYLGITPYGWQTAGNILAILSALIAAALYGNIGIKVIYNNILVDWLGLPPLTQRGGKLLWVIFVPIYWSLAFVIGAAIPDFTGFVTIISAVSLIHFTYTFPPLLHIGFSIQKAAIRTQEGEGFDPTTGVVTRLDSGIKRIIRGYMSGRWYLNIFNTIYFLGGMATAGLGVYAAVEQLKAIYALPEINAYGCHSPEQGT